VVPKLGPSLFSVRTFANASIPSVGSVVTPTPGFRWPRALFCTGLLLVPQSGSPADAAALSVRLQDETFADIITDGFGTTLRIDGCAMSGIADSLGFGRPMFRPFAFQRPVLDGDTWTISVFNASGAPIVVAGLHLLFDEGLRKVA
jgi:hypothetical protein